MKPFRPISKQNLRIPGLLKLVRRSCERIQDTPKRAVNFSLADCLMSGVAMFGLKYPSLLQFDNGCRHDDMLKHNLKTLYNIENAPSDTYFRERLDKIEPFELQKPMDRIISLLKRGKVIDKYKYRINDQDEYYLVSIDATGNFSSHEVHCESCCVKKHKDGTVTYYHQTLAAVMVHPEHKTVLPLAIEPITKKDGNKKNDCEHSAAKRLLVNLRNSHPDLKIIVVMDGLYADGNIISLLKELKFSFIITAKEKDLDYLFDAYSAGKNKEELTTRFTGKLELNYKFAKTLPLNYARRDIEVNILECTEINKDKHTRFCWITDLSVTGNSVPKVACAGRSRWKIENETFNTLKNQGYHFEHNFGHGHHNLSSVLTYLMFIAFLIDQIQQCCCEYFIMALEKCKTRVYLWNKIRGLFLNYFIDSWKHIYQVIIQNLGGRLSNLLDTG